jgi:transposase
MSRTKEGFQMAAATTQFNTQRVGALPVIALFCDRLQLGRTVDAAVPWEGEVPLGDLVEILVANRLLDPKPLYKLGSWATRSTLADFYNLTEQQLHDDRIGRALERLADHGDKVQAELVLLAIQEFGLDVSQVHYDLSTVELYGDYSDHQDTQADEAAPRPTYGRSKSGRKDLKQIQFGINVTKDGAVPVCHRAFDGNAAEGPTHLGNLQRLRELLPKGGLLYMADSKLDSKENLLAVVAGKGKFLCGGAMTVAMQDLFLGSVKGRQKPLDYAPRSQQPLPQQERDQYRGAEAIEELQEFRDGRFLRCRCRLAFVWSESKARLEAQTRRRHMDKVKEAFEQTLKNLNRYSLKTPEAVRRRLEAARSRYSEGKLFGYELGQDASGQLTLRWHVNAEGLARLEALEGVFLLKTNLAKKTHPTAEVLRTYREQIQVERRIGNLKGPLAVAPMFLKNPKRMAGLLYVLVWALMVMSLMERQVRRELGDKPMYGLYPENRPSKAPTGVRLIEAFEYLCVILLTAHGGKTTRHLGELNATQLEIIKFLKLSPEQLTTFKRRCGT